MRVTILANDGHAARSEPAQWAVPSHEYRLFDTKDVGYLPIFLAEQINRSQGLMMMFVLHRCFINTKLTFYHRIIEDYQAWAYDAIKGAIPVFPPTLLSGSGDMGLAMLPLFDDDDRGRYGLRAIPNPSGRPDSGASQTFN